MIVTYTIQSNKDEYLSHDGHEFWRFFEGDKLCWKMKIGGHWVDANIENLEKIYILINRNKKLNRILC